MKFRELSIGDTFDFIAPTGYNSFFNRCTKTSIRKYQWKNPIRCSLSPAEFLETRVGTINVEVYHIERKSESCGYCYESLASGPVCPSCGGV